MRRGAIDLTVRMINTHTHTAFVTIFLFCQRFKQICPRSNQSHNCCTVNLLKPPALVAIHSPSEINTHKHPHTHLPFPHYYIRPHNNVHSIIYKCPQKFVNIQIYSYILYFYDLNTNMYTKLYSPSPKSFVCIKCLRIYKPFRKIHETK